MTNQLFEQHLEQGYIHRQEGNNKKAIKFFKKAIEKDHANIKPHSALLTMYMASKDYKKAIKCQKAIMKIDSPDSFSYRNLACIYICLKDYDSAIENCNKALECDNIYQDESFTYMVFGDIYLEMKDYDQAIDNFKKSVETTHKKFLWQSYRSLGSAYLEMGNCDKAIENLNIALNNYDRTLENTTKDTGEWQIYDDLSRVYASLVENSIEIGDYDKAIENYNMGLLKVYFFL